MDELSFCNTTIEIEGFKLLMNMYDFTILATYRSQSGSIENFSYKMKHILKNGNLNDKKVILIGEFSISLADENSENNMFYNIMSK